ncbi:hypothetical protein LCGC14_1273510 [marine sediment metagenome]|uniref:Peptidase M75 n=2 Tax=root TaxID=1 RepID=A0A831VRU9_9FLAO|nr:peptidase M75 [Pricia antarctica]
MRRIFGVLLLLTVLWACSSDDSGGISNPQSENENPENTNGGTNFERKVLLANWADNIIIPSYEAFSTEVVSLKTTFEAFKSDASEANLVALRAAWLSAYRTWQKVSMFEIGPAESVGLRLNVNIYPTDTEKIAGFLASGSYDLSLTSNRDAKGFPALDYLINGLGENDVTIVSKFNEPGKEALISYVENVINDMSGLTAQVLAEWKQGYRDTFVNEDGSSATASVDRFANDFVFYYEKYLRAGKMGIPLGVFSGVQSPNTVESYYSPTTANLLFLDGLNSVQNFFNGKHFGSDTQGESLASYLDALNRKDLSEDINAQFDSARIAVESLNSFRIELETSDPAVNMLTAYDVVQKAVPLLKVDMFSAMSISIDFVDADGD